MERKDVPMASLHHAQASLETLDRLLQDGPSQRDIQFIRTCLLGIMARLDAAIVEINES